MDKVLESSVETRDFLASLPTIYLVGVWARAGIRPYPFAKLFKNNLIHDPLVYDYDDHNGATDAFYLRPLSDVTTGQILGWSSDKATAQQMADDYNLKHSL